MKGVVLAGGLGTRLMPMTKVTNKHLLPVFDRPMVYYPLQQLATCGVEEVLVVAGGNHAEDFPGLLGDGADFGLTSLSFAYQEEAGGIADALSLAASFADGGPVAVVLGDNIFQDSLDSAIAAFRNDPRGAVIFLKEVTDPERFGVARVEGGRVVEIVEKPRDPASAYAVSGCYLYDSRVFDIVSELEPSDRGELEITDVNNRYLAWGELRHVVLDGWWTDAGTVESLHRAAIWVADDQENPVLTGRSR